MALSWNHRPIPNLGTLRAKKPDLQKLSPRLRYFENISLRLERRSSPYLDFSAPKSSPIQGTLRTAGRILFGLLGPLLENDIDDRNEFKLQSLPP